MRANVLSRTLVSVTAVAGLAAGGLAGAGVGYAASAPASEQSDQVASSGTAVALSTSNWGLSTAQAVGVQCWLHNNDWGYNGPYDGLLGTNSWKALQRYLKFNGWYTGPIDGIVGGGTVTGFQKLLKNWGYYSGPVDGIVGSGTEAAFSKWADYIGEAC
ncbi:peptidoglycan-binding domain-containing protein [Streptomyces sediminimaris]|uniref:peptidoglycan-binding domain-containing protein n=1 Tax=Streptomyces sediminimaris TaxID=3383721 RepID=UPI00399BC75D